MKKILIAMGGIAVSFALIAVILSILVVCGIVLFFSSFGRGIEID